MTLSLIVTIKCKWCGIDLDRRSMTQAVYFCNKDHRKRWRKWKRKQDKKNKKLSISITV